MKTVKVKYTGCSNGQANFGHGADPRPVLTEGLVYTLSRPPEVHSWHTLYYLDGFKKPFNSVCFEEEIMSDSYGPSEDCIVCGEAQSFGSLVRCYGCDTDMCGHCRKDHDCQKIMDERLEEFIKKLTQPLADALEEFGYSLNDESEKDGQRIFEFISSDAPRLEVRLDKP